MRPAELQEAELREGGAMYENSNQEAVRELRKESARAHKGRNFVVITAVFLTTLLITAFLSVGISYYKTGLRAQKFIFGGGDVSGIVLSSPDKREEIEDYSQVEWAALVRRCSESVLHNREFSGVRFDLYAPEAGYYEKFEIIPKKGTYPQAADEILVPDEIFSFWEGGADVGSRVNLSVMISGNDGLLEQVLPFTICGTYSAPVSVRAEGRGEIYTSAKFIEERNPELPEGFDRFYIKFGTDLEGRPEYQWLLEINGEVNGQGVIAQLKEEEGLLNQMLLPLALSFLTMVCGYLLIYNVFSISVGNDIRFYGLLKTIGTTKRQLRKILYCQAAIDAAAGIVPGLLAGALLANLAGPQIIMRFTEYGAYYENEHNLLIYLLAAIFAAVTVLISCRKPFRTGSEISPAASLSYTGRRWKKSAAMFSFAAAGILFIVVFHMALGYNMNDIVNRYNQSEISIYHRGSMEMLTEAYSPVPQELVERLRELPFVDSIDLYYMARVMPDYDREGGFYKQSTGWIRDEGAFKDETDSLYVLEKGYDPEYDFPSRDGRREVGILGMPASVLTKEMQNTFLFSGEAEEEKFATGDYILYQSLSPSMTRGTEKEIKAGTTLSLSFWDGTRYIDRTFTVLAVVGGSYEDEEGWHLADQYGRGNIGYNNIILPDFVFCEIYPNAPELISRIEISGSSSSGEQDLEEVNRLIAQYDNYQLGVASSVETRREFTAQGRSAGTMGLFIAAIIGLIGAINLINTIIGDINAKKQDLAAMQSVGMTKLQLFCKIWGEGLFLCGAAVLIMLPVSFGLILLLGKSEELLYTGFQAAVYWKAVVAAAGAGALLSGIMAAVMSRELNRKPLVERIGSPD